MTSPQTETQPTSNKGTKKPEYGSKEGLILRTFDKKITDAMKLFGSNMPNPIEPIPRRPPSSLGSLDKKWDFFKLRQATKLNFDKKKKLSDRELSFEIPKTEDNSKTHHKKPTLDNTTSVNPAEPMNRAERRKSTIRSFIHTSKHFGLTKNNLAGNNPVEQERLHVIYDKLKKLYYEMGKDQQVKDQFRSVLLKQTDTPQNLQVEISTVKNKKKIKTLKKQLKIYDQNFCIAMAFVTALNKSLLFLTDEKHQVPRELDFSLKNRVSLGHLARDIYDFCRFVDFAPLVFQRIRFYDGISNEEFVKDIGYNDFSAIFSKKITALKEEKSTGKSGSVFFQSSNGKYYIKTIRKSEVNILKKSLKNYYHHLEEVDAHIFGFGFIF